VRRMTKGELSVLVVADRHGEYRPGTKAQVDICIALAADEYLSEHDNAPGIYWITSKGERALTIQLALVKN
jgi:hypothetical protein